MLDRVLNKYVNKLSSCYMLGPGWTPTYGKKKISLSLKDKSPGPGVECHDTPFGAPRIKFLHTGFKEVGRYFPGDFRDLVGSV